jgi:hypothetical protein
MNGMLNSTGQLTLANRSNFAGLQVLTGSNTATHGSVIRLKRSRGTSSLSAVVDGDLLGGIFFSGYDGNSTEEVAGIAAYATGTVTTSSLPTSIQFSLGTTSASRQVVWQMNPTELLGRHAAFSKIRHNSAGVPSGISFMPSGDIIIDAVNAAGNAGRVNVNAQVDIVMSNIGHTWAFYSNSGRAILGNSAIMSSTTDYLSFTTSQIGIHVNNTNSLIVTQNAAEVNGGVSGTFTLEVNGSAAKTDGTTWSAPSDRRLKTDIVTIQSGLDKIANLNPVTFRYSEEYRRNHNVSDRLYAGWIAQEYKEVFPADVSIDDETGMMSVAPDAVVPHLVKAIQELQEEIALLKQKIASLE